MQQEFRDNKDGVAVSISRDEHHSSVEVSIDIAEQYEMFVISYSQARALVEMLTKGLRLLDLTQ